MIYEFITPSDPITFIAFDDKIAIAASILLAQGKAGCKDENGKSIPTMYLFHPDPMPEIEKDLGEPINDFLDKHEKELADCFSSFAYGGIEDRKQFDDAMDAITDEKKKKEFKKKHEDRNRTSMSQWVNFAWKLSSRFEKKYHEKIQIPEA